MVVINSVPIEEAVRSRTAEPSERARIRQQIEADARTILEAIQQLGAAQIDFSHLEMRQDRYMAGLRNAFVRLGRSDILLRARRRQSIAYAWAAREEDLPDIERRRLVGQNIRQALAAKRQAAGSEEPRRTRRRARERSDS